MIEEYTVRFLDAVGPTISGVSPPVYLGVLLGIINSCLFYLFFGRGLARFLPYLALGATGALAGATMGSQLPESGPILGDVQVAATSLSTWTILFVARSLRL